MDTIQDILNKHGIADPPCGATAGKGWLPLLDRLITDLIALGWDKDCQQIKTKFGDLRFYIGEGSKEIHQRISEAATEAGETCSQCGAPRTYGDRHCR